MNEPLKPTPPLHHHATPPAPHTPATRPAQAPIYEPTNNSGLAMILIAGFLVMVTAAAALLYNRAGSIDWDKLIEETSSESDKTKSPASSDAPTIVSSGAKEVTKSAGIGETISSEGLSVTAANLKEVDSLDYIKPGAGEKLLTLKVTIKNELEDSIYVSPIYFKAYGVKGAAISASSRFDEGSFSGKELDPGDSASGEIYFKIKDTGVSKIEFSETYFPKDINQPIVKFVFNWNTRF